MKLCSKPFPTFGGGGGVDGMRRGDVWSADEVTGRRRDEQAAERGGRLVRMRQRPDRGEQRRRRHAGTRHRARGLTAHAGLPLASRRARSCSSASCGRTWSASTRASGRAGGARGLCGPDQRGNGPRSQRRYASSSRCSRTCSSPPRGGARSCARPAPERAAEALVGRSRRRAASAASPIRSVSLGSASRSQGWQLDAMIAERRSASRCAERAVEINRDAAIAVQKTRQQAFCAACSRGHRGRGGVAKARGGAPSAGRRSGGPRPQLEVARGRGIRRCVVMTRSTRDRDRSRASPCGS